jgi:conjugative relaxase-like TrwC/TraI family protein
MISNAPVNKPDYYSKEFMKDDYYNKADKQSEGIGTWHGEGAKALGLENNVKPREFWNVLKGLNPDGESKLSKYFRNEPKDFGQDFTFNANKYFSLLLNVYPDGSPEKEKLENRWKEYNDFCRDEITKRLTTREGKEYKAVKGAVCATWTHETSREDSGKIDFQKHTHNVFANFAQNEKGQWKAVDFKRAFEDKLLIASQGQEILAKAVNELGFQVMEGKTGWTIRGITEETVDHFSGRSNKIKEKTKDDSSYDARQKAANEKNKKGDYNLHDLQIAWKSTLDTRFGISPKTLEFLRQGQFAKQPEITKEDIIRKACQISKGANFTEKHLDVAIAQKAQARDFDKSAMKDEIMGSKDIEKSGVQDKKGNELMFNSKFVSKEHKGNMREFRKLQIQIKKVEAYQNSMEEIRTKPPEKADFSKVFATPSQPTRNEPRAVSMASAPVTLSSGVASGSDMSTNILMCQSDIDNIQNALMTLDQSDINNLDQINSIRQRLIQAKTQLAMLLNQQSMSEHKAQMAQLEQNAKEQQQQFQR